MSVACGIPGNKVVARPRRAPLGARLFPLQIVNYIDEEEDDQEDEAEAADEATDVTESEASSEDEEAPGSASDSDDVTKGMRRTLRSLQRRRRREERRRRRRMEVGVELEVHPRYVVPDTNCFISHLAFLARLVRRPSPYTLLVPYVVVSELEGLSRIPEEEELAGPPRKPADLPGVGSRKALAFLRGKGHCVKGVTTRGHVLPNVFLKEAHNGEEDNDDLIVRCCEHFSRPNPAAAKRGCSAAPARRYVSEVVLLTGDTIMAIKALAVNVPVRTVQDFAKWVGPLPECKGVNASAVSVGGSASGRTAADGDKLKKKAVQSSPRLGGRKKEESVSKPCSVDKIAQQVVGARGKNYSELIVNEYNSGNSTPKRSNMRTVKVDKSSHSSAAKRKASRKPDSKSPVQAEASRGKRVDDRATNNDEPGCESEAHSKPSAGHSDATGRASNRGVEGEESVLGVEATEVPQSSAAVSFFKKENPAHARLQELPRRSSLVGSEAGYSSGADSLGMPRDVRIDSKDFAGRAVLEICPPMVGLAAECSSAVSAGSGFNDRSDENVLEGDLGVVDQDFDKVDASQDLDLLSRNSVVTNDTAALGVDSTLGVCGNIEEERSPHDLEAEYNQILNSFAFGNGGNDEYVGKESEIMDNENNERKWKNYRRKNDGGDIQSFDEGNRYKTPLRTNSGEVRTKCIDAIMSREDFPIFFSGRHTNNKTKLVNGEVEPIVEIEIDEPSMAKDKNTKNKSSRKTGRRKEVRGGRKYGGG